MKKLIAAGLLALTLPLSALAQDDETRRTIDLIKARLKDQPDNPTLTYYLAGFQARAGDKADALASLARLAEIGDGFLPTTLIGFEPIWHDAGFRQAYEKLEAKLPRVDRAPVAFEIDDKRLIPEGIAHDPVTGDFFVGGVARPVLLRVTAQGKVSEFSKPADRLAPLLGVAVDAKRRRVHAVATSALTEAGRKSLVNEVVTWNLATGERVGAVPVPAAQQLNDVAVAPNGDLYVTDSAAGAVWRIRDGKVEPFLPVGQARGTNGLAVTPDGKHVYVAHSTGVVRLDTATATLTRVAPPRRDSIAGIDGLYWHQGDLLGVQNVTNPGRVIRIRLAADGITVKKVDTLQSHHNPAFDEPTTGVVAGGAFYVLATTQVARFNEKGEIEKPETLKNPKVVRVKL